MRYIQGKPLSLQQNPGFTEWWVVAWDSYPHQGKWISRLTWSPSIQNQCSSRGKIFENFWVRWVRAASVLSAHFRLLWPFLSGLYLSFPPPCDNSNWPFPLLRLRDSVSLVRMEKLESDRITLLGKLSKSPLYGSSYQMNMAISVNPRAVLIGCWPEGKKTKTQNSERPIRHRTMPRLHIKLITQGLEKGLSG